MKIEKNSKYFTICVYAIVSVIIIIGICLIFINFKYVYLSTIRILKKILLLFKPLIFAAILAYLMDPVVEFYETKCKSTMIKRSKNGKEKQNNGSTNKTKRTMPVILATLTVLAFIGIFILMIVMNVKNALGYIVLKDVMTSINSYIDYFENVIINMNTFMNDLFPNKSDPNTILKLYHVVQNFISNLIHNGINTITSVGANIVNIALACVIAFYLLKDKYSFLLIWHKIIEKLFSDKWVTELHGLSKDLDHVFSGYIRGQIIDSVIIAVLTSIGLTLIGLDFAIIIGIIVGIFNLIPYFGPIVGEIIAGIIGFSSGRPIQALYAILTVLAIQQLDAFYFVPKIIGNSVKLHPVIVLISIFIGGNIFGLVGMLLGVPIAAFIRVLLIRYMGDIFSENN